MINGNNLYEQPPVPSKWTQEERRWHQLLMDIIDDIYLHIGSTTDKLEAVQADIAERLKTVESTTAENSESIQEIAGGGTVVPTAKLTQSAAITCCWNGSGLLSGATTMQQGLNGNAGQHYGGCFFNGLTALAGKTLVKATLRIRRTGSGGLTSGKVGLATIRNTGASGSAPSFETKYGSIGTISQGGTLDLTETAQENGPLFLALAEIASGDAKGLCFYGPNDTEPYGSKTYSRNYMMLVGTESASGKPKLTVEYQE